MITAGRVVHWLVGLVGVWLGWFGLCGVDGNN